MKIMIDSDLAPPVVGGAERYVINLGSRLARIGHEVHWITALIPNTSAEETYDGIKIHRIKILFRESYRSIGRLSYALTSIIPGAKTAKGMDILQFNTFVAGVNGWLIAKLARKPSVLFCHEFFGDKWKFLGQNFHERNLYPFIEKFMAHMPYDRFICPSEYSKETLKKAGASEDKIDVIPHGINLEIFVPSVSGREIREKYSLGDTKTFGYTGRLSLKKYAHAKNLIALLKASKIVFEKVPNSKLVFGGTGFENLQQMIKELGIEDRIIYVGEREPEKVGEFYGAVDVVICPALSEGFCFLTAEALACGRPVVATGLGAHNERIVNGETGLLSGDSPEEIADAIIRLLEDKDFATRLGKNAAEASKKLTWENSVNKHLGVYRSVLENRRNNIGNKG